jgi:hypothetical protein
MPITTISMEWLLQVAWSLLGHVVRRATDTVLTVSGASARIYQRSGGLPPLSHSLVHQILRVPAISTSQFTYISARDFRSSPANWRRLRLRQ